jgi:hypothetical protein
VFVSIQGRYASLKRVIQPQEGLHARLREGYNTTICSHSIVVALVLLFVLSALRFFELASSVPLLSITLLKERPREQGLAATSHVTTS